MNPVARYKPCEASLENRLLERLGVVPKSISYFLTTLVNVSKLLIRAERASTYQILDFFATGHVDWPDSQ